MILLNTHPASERLKRAKSRNCQNDRERIGMFGYLCMYWKRRRFLFGSHISALRGAFYFVSVGSGVA